MRDLVRHIAWMVVDVFLWRAVLEAEILTLRQQINVLRRTAPKKQTFSSIDRLIFVCLYRLLPGVRDALAIAKPETVVKWHRAGFRLYWRWKSKARGGRPTVPLEIRKFIREMSGFLSDAAGRYRIPIVSSSTPVATFQNSEANP